MEKAKRTNRNYPIIAKDINKACKEFCVDMAFWACTRYLWYGYAQSGKSKNKLLKRSVGEKYFKFLWHRKFEMKKFINENKYEINKERRKNGSDT